MKDIADNASSSPMTTEEVHEVSFCGISQYLILHVSFHSRRRAIAKARLETLTKLKVSELFRMLSLTYHCYFIFSW